MRGISFERHSNMSRTRRAIQVPGSPVMAEPQEAQAVEDAHGTKISTDADPLADYSQRLSTDADAKILKRAVLCKDGWLCPDLPPQAAQRA